MLFQNSFQRGACRIFIRSVHFNNNFIPALNSQRHQRSKLLAVRFLLAAFKQHGRFILFCLFYYNSRRPCMDSCPVSRSQPGRTVRFTQSPSGVRGVA